MNTEKLLQAVVDYLVWYFNLELGEYHAEFQALENGARIYTYMYTSNHSTTFDVTVSEDKIIITVHDLAWKLDMDYWKPELNTFLNMFESRH